MRIGIIPINLILGFDLRFLNNRLSATVDVYYDINSDILNQNIGGIIGTPIFAGGALTEVNFGRIDAFGSEFSLNWRDKIDQVKYNIGVNFGFNGNRVREWPQSAPSYIQENSVREGASTIFPTYGIKYGEVQVPEMVFYGTVMILRIIGTIYRPMQKPQALLRNIWA